MTEYRCIPWAEALTAHADEWRAIVQERGLNPTLLPEWTGIIVESLLDPSTVQVLVGTNGSGLTGLLPFHRYIDRIGPVPVRILEPVSSVVSYHAELVSRENPAGLLRALVQAGKELPWDMARLTGILADSPTEQAILEIARESNAGLIKWPGKLSPYMPLATSEQLVASRNKRERYQIRKHAKQFAEIPGSGARWYGKDSDTEELLQAILHIEAGSWKQAAGVAISGNPRETDYYRRLLPWLAATDQLVAHVLSINDEPVAYCLCYSRQGAVGCMKGSYLDAYARLAVGHHADDQLIMRVADAGALEFDFLGDADAYKLAWTRKLRQHSDYFLYATRGRGRWLGMLQQVRNRLRKNSTPAARQASKSQGTTAS